MGATKRLLEEPECCGECGAELEWDNGERVCAADCPTTQMDRYERLAMNPRLRAEDGTPSTTARASTTFRMPAPPGTPGSATGPLVGQAS